MMEILRAIEASGFAMFIKESDTAYTTFLAFHTIGLAFLVGISGATAMRVLGIARSLPLAPLEGFYPLMYAGFWINAVTGVVLLTLYPTVLLVDGTIYIKLAGVAAAMVYVQKLRHHVFGNAANLGTAAGAQRARQLSVMMLVSWMIAITAGRVTAYNLPTKLATAAAVLVASVVVVGGYVVARNLGLIKSEEQAA